MEWFESWFDSKYYHILYKNRDDDEARFFIQNLISFLKLPKGSKVLDLACGKGRHAAILAENGFKTMGVDLAANSIEEAKKIQLTNLHFSVHDMREPLNEKFNAVFNLFTSFGYFKDLNDNLKVIKSIESMLEPTGTAIIDFMNANKVINNLVPEETKKIEDITFEISRKYENQHIIKKIDFEAEGRTFHFEEKVQGLKKSDFEHLIQQSNLSIDAIFGDYDLSTFNENTSNRLILVLKK